MYQLQKPCLLTTRGDTVLRDLQSQTITIDAGKTFQEINDQGFLKFELDGKIDKMWDHPNSCYDRLSYKIHGQEIRFIVH